MDDPLRLPSPRLGVMTHMQALAHGARADAQTIIPVNLCKNKTPGGRFQIARVLLPGGPKEGEFEVLFEGNEPQANDFARQLVDEEYPGLR